MIQQTYKDIVSGDLLVDAIENREFKGFLEDYHVLHCLLKTYKPKSFFEVGTNMGTGTSIITNVLSPIAKVYSLDLPFETVHESLIRGDGDIVGINCTSPFTQLRGDSMTFDYAKYPCEGYFIDGEHDFEHPFHETTEILKLKPNIVIWHDSDIPEVYEAIDMAFSNSDEYDLFLYRVRDTRIAYAVRDNNNYL